MPTDLALHESASRLALFADLDGPQLEELLGRMEEASYNEGEWILRRGATDVGLYVIVDGEVDIAVDGQPVDTASDGDYFGEIALIDEGVRSASITAATDLRCYGITPWEFRPFVEEHPHVAWALLENLARRLRAAQAA